MKYFYTFIYTFFFSSAFPQSIKLDRSEYFYENKGQIIDQSGKHNPKVKFLFNSNGLNVQIRNNGFSYDIYENEFSEVPEENSARPKAILSMGKHNSQSYIKKYHRMDIDFIGSNPNHTIVAEGINKDYDNYYNIASQPKGIAGVHRYEKIIYRDIYPNIDPVFFKPQDTVKPIEYNFIVNPGGRFSDIKMRVA